MAIDCSYCDARKVEKSAHFPDVGVCCETMVIREDIRRLSLHSEATALLQEAGVLVEGFASWSLAEQLVKKAPHQVAKLLGGHTDGEE